MKTAGLGVQFDEKSMVVTLVQPGSAAEQAGMLVGDVLVAVDGHKLDGMSRARQISLLRGVAGSEAKLTVTRGGEEKNFTITRGELK